MSINYDCPVCGGSGVKKTAIATNVHYALPPIYHIEERPCDCEAGRQSALWENQRNHPEYCNPFESMSDDEILEAIALATENAAVNRKEFDVNA